MPVARWLLFDADDTLWENNIYFEEAIKDFIAYVDHPYLSPIQVREELDAIEARSVRKHGYGTANFSRNLIACYEQFRGRACSTGEQQRLLGMTERIWRHPIELMPGVQDTLATLGQRHPLGLVTKGAFEEQQAKLARSGLDGYFQYVANVREKDLACYRAVIREIGCAVQGTWMIGNSPKSDINPALEAGLGAVLVPHRSTWSLEIEPVPKSHQRLRVVKRFSDLSSMF